MCVLRTIVGSNIDFYYVGKRRLHSVVEKDMVTFTTSSDHLPAQNTTVSISIRVMMSAAIGLTCSL